MVANLTECSRLEQRSILKFKMAEKYKPFTEECVMDTEKHVLVKKCSQLD